MAHKRRRSVDFYKGIAILLIILCHSAQCFKLPTWARLVPEYGQMGCQVFLVLSAYTLSISRRRHKRTYGQYICRRLKRIVPGYWTALIVYGILGIAVAAVFGRSLHGTYRSAAGYAVNMLLLHGLIPSAANNKIVRGGWFIGTIFLFYLIFPMMDDAYKKMGKHRRIIFPAAIQLLAFLVIAVVEYATSMRLNNNSFLYFNLVNQLPCLSLGIVMAEQCELKKLRGGVQFWERSAFC